MALLPDDVLAEVLRRLPPRGLAASRCVCKSWRAVVDARRLLRADLLPLSLGGFFFNFNNLHVSEFLAPVSNDSRPSISIKLDYLPEARSRYGGYVDDHCNGLVLVVRGYDDNPATRWVVSLPPCPPPPMEIKDTIQIEYLAYDPADSPYFEVVSFTCFQWIRNYRRPGDFLYGSSTDAVDHEIEESEWPPPVCIFHVFSSRTGQWEKRSFAREGNSSSMGIVSGMRQGCLMHQRNAVYWRGALYVHCQTDCVIKISLSGDKYHVIKPPMGTEVKYYPRIYLGKSSNGVYFALINGGWRVQVWNLDESGCQMEWVLKLWFHPYKEIIFLSESITRGLAYHLNSSKVEVLGNIYPAGYENDGLTNEQLLQSSFPYTPCWLTHNVDENS